MTAITYIKGQTFRHPEASRARAEYAATLRDLGFTYSSIARALGLPAHTKERARRIVQLGRRLKAQSYQRLEETISQVDNFIVTYSPPTCEHSRFRSSISKVQYAGHLLNYETCEGCGEVLSVKKEGEKVKSRPVTDDSGCTLRPEYRIAALCHLSL